MSGTANIGVINTCIDKLMNRHMTLKEHINCSKALFSELLPNSYRDKICFLAGCFSQDKVDMEVIKIIINQLHNGVVGIQKQEQLIKVMLVSVFPNNPELRKEVFVEIKRSILGE